MGVPCPVDTPSLWGGRGQGGRAGPWGAASQYHRAEEGRTTSTISKYNWLE